MATALVGGITLHELAAAGPGSEVENIASPAGPGSGEPNLAVARDGRVYMSWLEPVDSGHALRIASYDGLRWSEATTIRSGRDFFVNWADFPSIEVVGESRLAAHWLQRTGKGTYAYGVRVSQSRDGGRTWSAPVTPHSDTSNTEHGFVALWRDGDALGAAWLDGRKYDKEGHNPSNEMMLMATSIDAAGRRSSPEVIVDPRVCDCCQTAVAMTSRGPILAYRDRSPGEIRDIYVTRRLESAGRGGLRARRWTQPKSVHDDHWRINACPVNGPAVDARNDRVAVAWFTAANDSPRVKAAFSTNSGETFAPPVRVDDGAPGGRVDVAMLNDGSALVSWIERVGGDTAAVRVRRVQPRRAAGASLTIARSSAARASGFPRMAVSGDDVFFAWTVPGSPSQVRVARTALANIR